MKTNGREPAPRVGPLLWSQEGYWIEESDIPSDVLHEFNMVRIWNLPVVVDEQRVRSVIALLQERHEILRTIFSEFDEYPTQKVLPVSAANVDKALVIVADRAAMQRVLREGPFDLAHPFPYRFAIEAGEVKAVGFVTRHIAFDRTALEMLRDEVLSLLSDEQPPSVDPLPSLIDLAIEERVTRTESETREYWATILRDCPNTLFPAVATLSCSAEWH